MRDERDEFEIDAEAAENRRAQGEDTDAADETGAAGKVAKLKREIEALKKEKQEYLDGWQRSKADYANAQKRFDEERTEAAARGAARAAEALLPALDSLERAKASGELPESFAGIVKQLETGFAKLGLVPFGAAGDTFDPALHEALGSDTAASADEDGTITAVLEPGYRMGERVLRPAKVRVAHLA
ncbi:MAG: nucleotide exchange factor GrpE [bacterium]